MRIHLHRRLMPAADAANITIGGKKIETNKTI